MAKSIKYKEADTYHDAGNVYDNTQGKTQEEINASLNTETVSLQFSSKVSAAPADTNHCVKIGNIAIVSLQCQTIAKVNANEPIVTIPIKTNKKIITRLSGSIQMVVMADTDISTKICVVDETNNTWLDGQIIIPISM